MGTVELSLGQSPLVVSGVAACHMSCSEKMEPPGTLARGGKESILPSLMDLSECPVPDSSQNGTRLVGTMGFSSNKVTNGVCGLLQVPVILPQEGGMWLPLVEVSNDLPAVCICAVVVLQWSPFCLVGFPMKTSLQLSPENMGDTMFFSVFCGRSQSAISLFCHFESLKYI